MKTYCKYILLTVIALLMAAGIHLTQEFRFYNIESNDLLLYDWADIWSRLQKTGGLATVLASFLTQFMRIPFVGTIVVTGLYMLSAYLIHRVLSIRGNNVMAGFSLLPVAFLFLCMENDYYRFQGHVAFVLMLVVLFAYASVRMERTRYITGILMIPVLFHAAGSVTLVFVISALVWELTGEGLKGMKAFAYPAVLAAVACIYVRYSLLSSWEHALTPFMYYDWPSTYFFPAYAWMLVPVLVFAAWVVSRLKWKTSYSKAVVTLGIVLSFFLAGNFYGKVHNRNFYRLIQEQYWAENQQWDKIIKTADRRQPTFLISYLNLALAHKGLLVQNFMYYNSQDLSSIMYPTPNLKAGLTLQSTVYSAWDYHAAARQAAFDANVVTSGNCNPRQLEALVRTNAALGAYDVAMKYITKLEKTLFYRGLAARLKESVEKGQDVVIPLTDKYLRYEGIKGDMRDILEAEPSHRILSQFHQVYRIIEKESAI